MVIWFNSKTAREYLEANGLVYTARKRRKQFGHTIAIYSDDMWGRLAIGKVNVALAMDSYESDNNHNHRTVLSNYVENSGFESLDKWIEEIQKLNTNRWLPEYLRILKVTMVND